MSDIIGVARVTRLRDGTPVLGKMTQSGIVAMTYANRAQAYAMAAKIPGSDVIHRGRPFYVRLTIRPQEDIYSLTSSIPIAESL